MFVVYQCGGAAFCATNFCYIWMLYFSLQTMFVGYKWIDVTTDTCWDQYLWWMIVVSECSACCDCRLNVVLVVVAVMLQLYLLLTILAVVIDNWSMCVWYILLWSLLVQLNMLWYLLHYYVTTWNDNTTILYNFTSSFESCIFVKFVHLYNMYPWYKPCILVWGMCVELLVVEG